MPRCDRRIHRQHRNQLQEVILDNIAQGSDGIVKRTPFLHAKVLGQRDIDARYVFTAPHRLE